MLKVYGSELCPDCIECKYNLDLNKIEYENLDINKNLKTLKAFLRLRDKEGVFDEAKEKGYIGIPALITDDERIILDWESYFTEQNIEVVHPAGGNEFTSVKISPAELEKVSGAEGWCDVCKGWDEDEA